MTLRLAYSKWAGSGEIRWLGAEPANEVGRAILAKLDVITMADQSFDPMAMWREMLRQWESNTNEVANKLMESPEFSQRFNGINSAVMSGRNALNDVMRRYLVAMNLPTRDEVLEIGERLQAMDAQLSYLTTLVEKLAGASADAPGPVVPPSGPPRTRQPPAPNAKESGQ